MIITTGTIRAISVRVAYYYSQIKPKQNTITNNIGKQTTSQIAMSKTILAAQLINQAY